MSDLRVIPGYRVDRELGQGGMARVYLAHEYKLDRPVALKVMVLSPTQDRGLSQRFVKEAKTAAGLRHSNIVSIHDVGETGQVYYMAMEYLDGGSLRGHIQHGPIDPADALGIVRQVASGLQYAHERGFVHRDIKPDNIMFRSDGTAVITDFGIARAFDAATRLIKTGMSIGTPHYMSPEQGRGRNADPRSDIYALGVVLCEMLTGAVRFDAENTVGIPFRHVQDPIPRLAGHLSRYQGLLDSMLAKEPGQRVQSGTKVCELVDALLGVRTTPGRGVPVARLTVRQAQAARDAAAAPSSRSAERLTDNGDGTVTDSRTGLMWAAKDNGSNITWYDAQTYCSNYRGRGWRMPTSDELESLYDPRSSQIAQCNSDPNAPLHRTRLIQVTCYWVWSSETEGSSDARDFRFPGGHARPGTRSHSSPSRALPIHSRR